MDSAGSTPSLRTAATPENLLRKQQIRPCLALLPGRAQQVGRVIGDDDWNLPRAVRIDLAAHATDGCIGLQQVLRGDPPDGEDDTRLDQLDLSVEVRRAERRLFWLRFAVVRRAAF